MDGKHLMCFRSEASVFKFLRCSVDWARVPWSFTNTVITGQEVDKVSHFLNLSSNWDGFLWGKFKIGFFKSDLRFFTKQ